MVVGFVTDIVKLIEKKYNITVDDKTEKQILSILSDLDATSYEIGLSEGERNGK